MNSILADEYIKSSQFFKEISHDGEHYRQKWLKSFAHHITEEDRATIYIEDFLWHVFSYNKLTGVKEEEARHNFNQVVTNGWLVFFQHNDLVYEIVDGKDITDAAFDDFDDVYVVDQGFKKCYVHTHEAYCGPYYIAL